MAAGDIHPNLLQSHHFKIRSNGCIHPCPILLTFGAHARHPPHHPVVRHLEVFLQPGGQNPRLGPEQNQHLHHCHTKPPHHSPIRSLPSQDLSQTSPFSSRPLEVPASRRWRTTTFVPGTRTKKPLSGVSHTPRIPSPSVSLYPQQPTSVTSSPYCISSSLNLGAPNLVPPV